MKKQHLTFKKIPKQDLPRTYKYYKEYTEGKSFSYLKRQYIKHPDLFVGCYDRQKLVGICLGFIMRKVAKDAVILSSIAIDTKYQRKGLGSRMLKFFHKQVKRTGEKKVSVAAASGYVERFYMKTGYKPKYVLVRSRRKELPANYRKFGYKIIEERGYGTIKKIYIEAKKYSPKLREKVKRKFNAYEVNYIFEKKV